MLDLKSLAAMLNDVGPEVYIYRHVADNIEIVDRWLVIGLIHSNFMVVHCHDGYHSWLDPSCLLDELKVFCDVHRAKAKRKFKRVNGIGSNLYFKLVSAYDFDYYD